MTTVTLPAPLVPAEVDLRDFVFMPLDVVRLRDSDLAALASGEAFKAAVMLWCVAWHQVPAASLPTDDRLLARHSGAGSLWRKVRDEALRGFVECSDGRLYHRTIAEKAVEAWEAKKAQRARVAAALAAREAKRRAEQAARDEQRDRPRDEQRDDIRDVERDVHQGTGIGIGIGTVKGQGDLLPPDGGSGAAPSAAPPTPPPDFDGLNAEALNGKAIVKLARGFELPAEWGNDAMALGFKAFEVQREGERFRQYFVDGRGKGTRRSVTGWRQSWSNWLGKAARDAR